jgi:hypothetical protein
MSCWHDEIDRSITEGDVVRSARDYLALWAPTELTPVTLGWREMKIESPADVLRVKRWLTETPQLHELASYFWHAAARIEQIRRMHLRLVTFPTISRAGVSLQSAQDPR